MFINGKNVTAHNKMYLATNSGGIDGADSDEGGKFGQKTRND